ncbi:hypothetical protein [Salinigranum marinum]|uniref:hypothetical protein n=1 Tax=Salinigranum marinum TaxID=1515595 RepID=UPI00298A071A|nr:hypothetical protein [Salinigranum marinum]
MNATKYELTDSVAGFDEGAILDVTARFGDWHTVDLKLESSERSPASTTVVVADSPGFTEAEILDETARIGDWHEFALGFDPGATDGPEPGIGRVHLTADEFERVAAPVTPTA